MTLKNVKIHDLKLKAMEIKALAFGEAGGAPKKLVDPVGAILNFVATDDHSDHQPHTEPSPYTNSLQSFVLPAVTSRSSLRGGHKSCH